MTSNWITLSLWKSLITYGMWTCVLFSLQMEQQQFRFTVSDFITFAFRWIYVYMSC